MNDGTFANGSADKLPGDKMIEGKIIEYFDGSLSDSESAEVLHRVSISPEIRQIFTEHEQLRAMAQRAVNQSAIAPEIEERLLSNIGRLAATPQRVTPAMFWNSTWFRAAAVLLLLAASAATAIHFNGTGTSGNTTTGNVEKDLAAASSAPSTSLTNPNASITRKGEQHSESVAAVNIATQSLGTAQTTTAAEYPVSRDMRTTGQSIPKYASRIIVRPVRILAPSATKITDNASYDIPPDRENFATNVSNVPSTSAGAIGEISPVEIRSQLRSTPLAIGGDGEANVSMSHLREPYPRDDDYAPRFEIGLQTSSGFSYPASGPSVHPFADFRGSIAYLITQTNLVGFRLSSGIFQTLPTESQTTNISYTVITRSLSSTRELSEELFYAHREIISSTAGLAIQGLIAGGLIPAGNTISLELGFQIPLSDRLMTSIDFALTRVHTNAASLGNVVQQDASAFGDTPIIFQGSDIRNTLNGRVQYGLAFRF